MSYSGLRSFLQGYLAALKPSGGARRQPPACAQTKAVFDTLYEYFHASRPDIVPMSTLSSIAGRSTPSLLPEPSLLEHSPRTAHSTPDLPKRTKQRVTATGVMAAFEKSRVDRRESEDRRAQSQDRRTDALVKLAEGSAAQPPTPPCVTKEQRQMMAEDHLGKLETSDTLAGREDVKVVLRKVRALLYGPDPALAAATVARLYALASRSASDEVCALRLMELSSRDM